jgi:hypothetical protein
MKPYKASYAVPRNGWDNGVDNINTHIDMQNVEEILAQHINKLAVDQKSPSNPLEWTSMTRS